MSSPQTGNEIAILNAAAIVKSERSSWCIPKTYDEAWRIAEGFANSDMVGKNYLGKPANVMVAMQYGDRFGMDPMTAMQCIAVINGNPTMWGDTLLALVRASGHMALIEETCDGKVATCRIQRRGEDVVVRTFTLDDAKKARLLGKQGPWQDYPNRMLQLRARTFALRDVFPDILRGFTSREEAMDMATPSNLPAPDTSTAAKLLATVEAGIRSGTGVNEALKTVADTAAKTDPATQSTPMPEPEQQTKRKTVTVPKQTGPNHGLVGKAYADKLGKDNPYVCAFRKILEAKTDEELKSAATLYDELDKGSITTPMVDDMQAAYVAQLAKIEARIEKEKTEGGQS